MKNGSNAITKVYNSILEFIYKLYTREMIATRNWVKKLEILETI
jgi:hypothetical protein